MKATFNHFDLQIIAPDFDSKLTDVIIGLEHLRKKQLSGTTHPTIFFQLKNIFHLLESIGSARIEGNNTTIAEFVETKINPSTPKSEKIREIENTENAMRFIDDTVQESSKISKAIISELHKITVHKLQEEGDKTPGQYRKDEVYIAGSSHKPPEAIQIESYMEELIDFINKTDEPKYDLLKTAITHHRFAWIHPFNNGNGRTVRLLTYAMLIKQGFNVKNGRILNPTAIFCIDRDNYYKMLSQADKGTRKGILTWSGYVLEGLYREITKIDKLTDHSYLSKQLLIPAINFCLERRTITNLEGEILKLAVRRIVFKSSDLIKILPNKIPVERSRILSRLKKNKLITSVEKKGRKYIINFSNNYLLRGIIHALKKEDFIVLGN